MQHMHLVQPAGGFLSGRGLFSCMYVQWMNLDIPDELSGGYKTESYNMGVVTYVSRISWSYVDVYLEQSMKELEGPELTFQMINPEHPWSLDYHQVKAGEVLRS